MHHALEHLGRRDHRLARQVALADDMLLDQGHLLRVDFDAEVAARHHDAVGNLENLVKGRHGLRLLDLGNHPDRRLALAEQLLELHDVRRRAHERERQVVEFLGDAEIEIEQILLGERRRRNRHARQVHPLAVLEFAADQHPAMHLVAGDRLDLQFEQAVIEQNPVAACTSCGRAW